MGHGGLEYSLRKTPLTLVTSKGYTKTRLIKDKNRQILVEAFTADFPAWPGASYIVAASLLEPGEACSIVMPITPTINACPVIRFTISGTVYRYKLWQDVGEILHYPLYAGEIIPATGALLEYWCVNDGLTTITLADDWYIPLAETILPTYWTDTAIDVKFTANDPVATHDPAPVTLADYFERCVTPV